MINQDPNRMEPEKRYESAWQKCVIGGGGGFPRAGRKNFVAHEIL